MRNLRWLLLSAAIIIADQLSKIWAVSALSLYAPQKIVAVFNLTLAHNYGAAFSFLAAQGGWQRWFLAVLAVIASIALVVWLYRLPTTQTWLAAALSLVLGGAIGNLIDRIQYGYVVDFFDFHWQSTHFPAFNIADTAITLGAIFLAVDIIIGSKKHD